MKNKLNILAIIATLTVSVASAQVGVGTVTPNAASILDVTSTTKGMLIPRMTTAQRTAIVSPVAGLQVYDTTTNTNWYHNGTIWVQSASTASGSKWTNDSAKTAVKLTNLSDGATVRPAQTEFVVTDAGNVGIGTDAPTTKLVILQGSNTMPAFAPSNSYRQRIISDGLNSGISLESYTPTATAGVIQGVKARGTIAAPTAGLDNDIPLLLASRSYDGSTMKETTRIELKNAGNTTSTTGGGSINFYTAREDGTQALTQRMVLSDQGSLAIGSIAPNAAAVLDVTSTTKGMLIPRMTTAQRTAIVSPVAGLQVYDTTTNTNWFHNGTVWVEDETVTASNGLTMASGDVKLGGALTAPTTISGLTATNKFAITGTGVNMFNVDGATLSVDATNGRIGIGTATPNAKLTIDETGSATTDGIVIIADNTPANITLNSVGTSFAGGNVTGQVGNGTRTAPTDVVNNDLSLVITGQGYDNGAFRETSRIEFRNSVDPSFTNPGGSIQFLTTNLSNGTTSGVKRHMILTDEGNLGVGVAPTGNITLTSKLQVIGLQVFASNAAAITGGLTVGAFYRDSVGNVKVVF